MLIVDPDDPQEQALLSQLNLDKRSKLAKTVLLSFPGKVLGSYEGPTDIDQFRWDLRSQCGLSLLLALTNPTIVAISCLLTPFRSHKASP